MSHGRLPLTGRHTFVVRIWWEPGLSRADGRALWRGQVQDVTSNRVLAFQTLDDLLRFIQSHTGDLGTVRNGESRG